VTEDTQQAIAEDLGVSEGLVSEVANDPDVKQFTREPINTDEKREQVRESGNRGLCSHRTPVRLEHSIRARAGP
jgi:hypothetical protein